MSTRSQRRRDLATYRHLAARELLVSLVATADRLDDAPVLQRAMLWWLEGFMTATPPRRCFACKAHLLDRRDAGAVLISMPANGAFAASLQGLCGRCWNGAEFDDERITRAATAALRAVCPNGSLVDTIE